MSSKCEQCKNNYCAWKDCDYVDSSKCEWQYNENHEIYEGYGKYETEGEE